MDLQHCITVHMCTHSVCSLIEIGAGLVQGAAGTVCNRDLDNKKEDGGLELFLGGLGRSSY